MNYRGNMKEFENELYESGIKYIAGIDEVGRGPLVGPVVTAAVILPRDFYDERINDSKKLTEKKRELLYDVIMENAVSVGIGISSEDVIDEINKMTPALSDPIYNLTTKCFWILNDIHTFDDPRFLCKYDKKVIMKGRNVYNINHGYPIYCSAKCRANDSQYKETLAQACINKYGVDNPFKAADVRNKIENTMVERYGVKAAAQNPDCFAKVLKSKQEKYSNMSGSYEKMKNHFTPELNDKLDNIFILKYGVRRPLQNKEILEKTFESQIKSKKGGTSKEEIKLYDLLCSKFGKDNVKLHYKSEKYPFYCDFYVTSKNIYIEYNGYWMHFGHPFDIKNENDVKIMNQLYEKSKHSRDSYITAGIIWMIKDVMKRKIAKINKLNFVEWFTYQEGVNWISNYEVNAG